MRRAKRLQRLHEASGDAEATPPHITPELLMPKPKAKPPASPGGDNTPGKKAKRKRESQENVSRDAKDADASVFRLRGAHGAPLSWRSGCSGPERLVLAGSSSAYARVEGVSGWSAAMTPQTSAGRRPARRAA